MAPSGGAARIHRRKPRHEVAPNPPLNRIADFSECRDRRPDACDAPIGALRRESGNGLLSACYRAWSDTPRRLCGAGTQRTTTPGRDRGRPTQAHSSRSHEPPFHYAYRDTARGRGHLEVPNLHCLGNIESTSRGRVGDLGSLAYIGRGTSGFGRCRFQEPLVNLAGDDPCTTYAGQNRAS